MPKVNWLPDDENTELTPLFPVALLGVLVRIMSPKFIGAKPVELVAVVDPLEEVPPVVVCASPTVASARRPERP